MKRLKSKNFEIDVNGNLHIVGYVWPDFPSTQTFDFWLFSVDADGCHNGDCRDEVNLDDLVNMQEDLHVNKEFVVYPNPVSNTLFLQSVAQDTPIQIIDALGHRVLIFKYNIEQGLNVEQLKSGVYFIRSENMQTGRFIKR